MFEPPRWYRAAFGEIICMGDIWITDKLLLFLVFFVPGFISMSVYGLFIATNNSDFTKRLPEVIAYSAIHYALTGWIVLVAPAGVPRLIAAYVVVLILPILWPPIILLARKWDYWRDRILTTKVLSYLLEPEATPWDKFFADQHAHRVRVKLKSGGYIGGIYGKGSWSSSYPAPEQLYVREQYEVDETGFGDRVKGSAGFLVSGGEIDTIEFFE